MEKNSGIFSSKTLIPFFDLKTDMMHILDDIGVSKLSGIFNSGVNLSFNGYVKGHLLWPFLQDVILVLGVPRMYL